MVSVLTNLTTACPGVPIAVVQPFNGGQTTHLQAAIKLKGSSDVKFVSTEGFYNMTLGGSLHPTGMNDVAQIAPKLANALRPMLAKGLVARYQYSGLL